MWDDNSNVDDERVKNLERDVKNVQKRVQELNEDFIKKTNVDQSTLINDLNRKIICLEDKFDDYSKGNDLKHNERLVSIKNQLMNTRTEFSEALATQSKRSLQMQKEIDQMQVRMNGLYQEQVDMNLRRAAEKKADEEKYKKRREEERKKDEELDKIRQEHYRKMEEKKDDCVIF